MRANIDFKNYTDSDYEALCSFLIALNENDDRHINWNWARLECMIEHPEFDKSLKNSIGIWTVDDKIVGAAIYDMYFGEGFCGVLPEYKDLYKAVLEYACKELRDNSGFGLAICDENTDELEMTKSLGFTPSDLDETVMERSLDGRSLDAKLPDGLKLFCPDPVENAYDLQWLFWQGFDHGDDKAEFEREEEIVPRVRKHFNKDLGVAAVNEKGEMSMDYIRVTKDNLEKEHICCAISNNKDVQVSSKKAWLTDRFDEGLVFLKSVERGKCFIEYIPAEYAWIPIEAEGYMYIDCMWVSGSFKGHGYSTDLLNACIDDSKEKGKKGLCILCTEKKKPFLADPKYLKYKGFSVSDEADNGIQLWYFPFDKGADAPRFKECARHPHIEEMGYVLYYTSQCPFNAKYVPVLEQTAKENNIPFHAIHIENREDAQNAPTPVTSYALFHDGEYVTNEQMNDKRFLKLIGQ